MGNNNLISSKKTYYISIAILAGMFFIFGFVSWVNAILIPYFRIKKLERERSLCIVS